jgi:hypothetical protein
MTTHTGDCPWTFHGVSRHDNDDDGTVTLTVEGWRYPTAAELALDIPIVRATAPCVMQTVPARYTVFETPPPAHTVQVIEAAEAAEMVRAHCGDWYTPVWQGKGWTVELATGVPIWQTTA